MLQPQLNWLGLDNCFDNFLNGHSDIRTKCLFVEIYVIDGCFNIDEIV